MFDQPIKSFMEFNFEQTIQDKFFPRAFDYLNHIIPILIEGKHTDKNWMQCVGSQSHHLCYMPLGKTHVALLLNSEQHNDTLFIVSLPKENDELKYQTVKAYVGFKDINLLMKECDRTGKNAFKFANFEEFQDFVNYIDHRRPNHEKGRFTSNEILMGKAEGAEVFGISTMEGKATVMPGHYYSFNEQLDIFSTLNQILCGVESHSNKETPKDFIEDIQKMNKFLEPFHKLLRA